MKPIKNKYSVRIVRALATSSMSVSALCACGEAPQELATAPVEVGTARQAVTACEASSDQVPVMTGSEAPGGRVFTSGAHTSSDPAYQAFDASPSSMWISEAFETPAVIGYEFAEGPRTIVRYAINYANGSITTRAPKDFTLEGFDGTSWVVVDARSNQTGWAGNERREYTVATPGSYSQYRLQVTDDNDQRAGVVVISMGDLELIGCDDPVSPVVVETVGEGEGWRQVHVDGLEDASGAPISERLTILESGADLATAPLPPLIVEAIQSEASAETHILADWVLEDLRVAEAQGTLTPRLLAIAEEETASGSSRSLATQRSRSCASKEVVKLKSVAKKVNYHERKELARGLVGEIDVNGDITASAAVEVRMTQTYVKVLRWCVPYGATFKSANIQGQLTVSKGARVEGNLEYADHWEQPIMSPYLGALAFMVGPVPVTVLISLPVTVGLDVSARVRAGVTYSASQAGQGAFNVNCTSGGCNGSASWNLQGHPLSDLVDADLSGEVHVNPWIEGGIRAALYDERLLYVEGGLKPMLQGHLWGYVGSNCGDADQDGTNENVRALMGDLNGTIYATGKVSLLSKGPRVWDLWHHTRHLGYANFLDDRSAAQPMIEGPAFATVGGESSYGIRMRPCWPFTDAVTYEVADGAGNTRAIAGAPTTPAYVPIRWNAPGRFDLSATALGDDAGRDFEATTTRRIEVQGSTERNLARDPGVSVSARSTFRGYSPLRVIDGSTSTALGESASWSNAGRSAANGEGHLPQWLDIELGGERQLEQIRVFTTAQYPIGDYDLQAWNGSAWQILHEVRGNTAAVREHDVSVRTSTIRIVGRRGPDRQPAYVRLNEVELYGY